LDELESTRCFSPSALESYLRCPFAWFVEKVIGIEELETPVDARLVGQLAHKALSQIYRELADSGALPLQAENLLAAEGKAAAVIAALVRSGECPGTRAERLLVERRLRQMVNNLLNMEAAAGGSLAAVATELPVGGEEGVDIGGLAISGRIDRVDSTPDGGRLFVLDYKSGVIPTTAEIGRAEGLQLPLYMLALARERPAQRVVGGAYLSLSEGKRSGILAADCEALLGHDSRGYQVDGEEALRQMLDSAVELAREAAAGIRGGEIAPRVDGRCPPWCKLGPVCRAPVGGYRQ
jgi:ATP-dependent helicase/DNAse subunit B